MSDETEYAMKYARERRMRINLEDRLLSLMYRLVPYAAVTNDLCHRIISKEADDVAGAIARLAEWQGDVELNLMLNLLKPAGLLEGISIETLENIDCLQDLPDEELNRLETITKGCSEKVEKEWDKLAISRGYATAEEYCERHKEAIIKSTLKAMKKHGLKPRSHV